MFKRIGDQLLAEDTENPLAQYDLVYPYEIGLPQADSDGVTDYIRNNELVNESQDLSALASLVNTGSPKIEKPKPVEPIIEELPTISSNNFQDYVNMSSAPTPTINRSTVPPSNETRAVEGSGPRELSIPSSVSGIDAIGQSLPEFNASQESQEVPKDELYNKYLSMLESSPKSDMSSAEADRNRAFIGSMLARVLGGAGNVMAARVGGKTADINSIADSIMKHGNESYNIAQDRAKATSTEHQNKLAQYLNAIKEQRNLDNTRFNQDLSLRQLGLSEARNERDQASHAVTLDKAILENDLVKQLNDPTSEISSMARLRASKAMKSNVPENVSAAQLKSIGFDKAVDSLAAERLELSRQRLEATREDMERKNRQGDARISQADQRLDFQKVEKYGKDARDALADMRATETFKSAEKQLTTIPEIKTLLADAYNKGGQSLSMLGPKIAKGIAGEVGVLTEQDVTRYVKNPQMVSGLMDAIAKIKSGQLTKTSHDNIQRLLDISEKTAKYKMSIAIDREAELLSRREHMSYDEARYLLDNEFRNTRLQGNKGKAVPGSIIKVKGKEYKVGTDGDTLEEIK